VSNEDHKASHFVVFSIPLLPSLLRSKYLPRHPILKQPQLLFSLNVSDQVSHPHKTTGKIIFLYILIFIFLDIKI